MEINFKNTIKVLGEINEKVYGVNPFQMNDIDEKSGRLTQEHMDTCTGCALCTK